MSPWQGSGAGQAIEDAMILEHLLQDTKKSCDLNKVLTIYDEFRRPRSQRIVHSSAHTGRILCGKEPGVGLEPDKIRKALGPMWECIYQIDFKEYKTEALAQFRKLKEESEIPLRLLKISQ